MSKKKSYNDLNSHLRLRFGCRVQRVPIDAGFGCPNRDGKFGKGGCVYCSERGSAAVYTESGLPIHQQLQQGIESASQRYRTDKFIAYYQAFTNTYLPEFDSDSEGLVSRLREIYQPAMDHPQVLGLAIGTRPDCLSDEVIDLLVEISKTKLLWLELGLQSVHDQTLKRINRGHDYSSFLDAVQRVRLSIKNLGVADTIGLELVAHIILGLPGETRDMMLDTARKVSRLSFDGIKIHLLHVVKGTELEQMYRRGELQILERDEYVGMVCDILELLPPDIVIHRLTGEAARTELVEPQWALDKSAVLSMIDEEMAGRDTKQGACYESE